MTKCSRVQSLLTIILIKRRALSTQETIGLGYEACTMAVHQIKANGLLHEGTC